MIIDAAWLDPNGKSYFTHNAKYYSDKDNKERSFPGVFTGLWFSSIDAALIGAGTRKGKIYFFSGELYTRFDFNTGKCETGYPSSIKKVWNIPFSKIDAAWSHPEIKNKYYMSSGSEYIRLTVDKGGFDSGYPKPISRHWHGIEFSHIDAVIQGTGSRSGKLYFFSGTQYVRYDMQSDKVDRGYPNNIMDNWGVPDSWEPETKHVQVRLMDVYCRETEDTGPFGSEDELTIIWSAFFGTQNITNQWRLKGIDNGDTKNFPRNKSLLFDGEITVNSSVGILIYLWDRDHSESAGDYNKFINQLSKLAELLANNEDETDGNKIEMAVKLTNKARESGLLNKLMNTIDSDDFLGEDTMSQPVLSLPVGNKDHKLRFTRDGADYTVRIRTVVT